MTLAQRYNRILRRQILHYASWHPVTDPYEVGDFGGFRMGVFQKLGNIRDFGVTPELETGNSSSLDFTSSGMTTVRTEAGVQVKVYSELDIEAKLELSFTGSNSMYVKSAVVNVTGMRSPETVARQLDATGRWNHRWRILRKVYTAVDPVILVALERDTSFTLSAKANVLKQLEIGNGSINIPVHTSNKKAVTVVGGTGPIALDLFRVRHNGAAGLEVAADDDDPVDGSEEWLSDADDSDLLPRDPEQP